MIKMSIKDKFYSEMTEEEKRKTILKYKEKYINKVTILSNMLGYSYHNFKAIFTEDELKQIEETRMELSNIQKSLEDNFNGNFDFSIFKKDMEKYVEIEKTGRNISYKILKSQLTKPEEFYSGESFNFIVHVPTDGTNNEIDENYKITSTSLISDTNMGTFDKGWGKYGFIFDLEEENFIVSSTTDLYSCLYPQEEFDNEDYLLQFYKNDMYVIDVNSEIFQMSETCIPIPYYMETVNKNTTVEVNGEPLNYDKVEIYNEIVLFNNEKLKKVGIFVRTVGDKNFNEDYIKAKEMAETMNLPLIEIDKSIYREKMGLTPLTPVETKNVIMNILRRIRMNNDLNTAFHKKYQEIMLVASSKGKQYTPNSLCLKIYGILRKANNLLTDEEIVDYINSIDPNYILDKEDNKHVNFTIHK